jgi:hypothetical protein
MRNPAFWLLFAALLGLSMRSVAVAANQDLPSVDDLKRMYDDKKYEDLVIKLSFVLSLHNEAGRSYDRYELYMLKGEAQMGRRQPVAASDAYVRAAKHTTDKTQLAMAVAMSELSRRCPNMKFTPQTGAAKGRQIDVTDPQARKPAFAALYADELVAAKWAIKDASEATTIPPIFDVIPWLKKLSAIEIAATDSDTQSAALVEQIGSHADQLIGAVIDKYAGRVAAIDRNAQTVISVTDQYGNTMSGPQGLDSREQKELKDIIADCAQIGPAVKDLVEGIDDKELVALAAKTDKTGAEANRVLHTGYGGWNGTATIPTAHP